MNIWCVKGSWDDFLDKLNKIGEIEKTSYTYHYRWYQ